MDYGKSPKKRLDSVGETQSDADYTTDTQDYDSDVENPPVPDLNKRLGYLRPSRELLEYYRKKIAEYDTEHEEVLQKLEEYKQTCEEQHKIQWEVRSREDEIGELQKALSDMQIYLLQEREHVLRLYAENDRLKIRELEDRKKIQHLLALNGATESEITYFLKEPPAKVIVPQHIPQKAESGRAERDGHRPSKSKIRSPESVHSMPESDRYYRDNQTLLLQIEALQSQLEEQTKLAKEQIEGLMDDRRVKIEEYEARKERDCEKIKTLTDKLHKTQELLYDSTKDFLELRYEGRKQERDWMGEKDKLLRDLDNCKQQLNISKDDTLTITETVTAQHQHKKYQEDIKALEYQLKQSQKMGDMYREQVIQLEDELGRIREEGDVNKDIFKDRSEKMSKRLSLMNARYQDLERRRNLEVEGFKTDIKHLRKRLKEVEKQLYKVTLGFEDNPDERPTNLESRTMRNVRRSAGRSKELSLKQLKSKIQNIETELRHL
ncbi:coiled-coil domain-containing protein 77-like [Tubulanus polymorphus]|uniref:coiled-coil domain-containing protein 77-like n=1 Tax=Tubulanus polymorphus TaxID=672921 RepID=UPI003DA63D6F